MTFASAQDELSRMSEIAEKNHWNGNTTKVIHLLEALDASSGSLLANEDLRSGHKDIYIWKATTIFRGKQPEVGLTYGMNLWMLNDLAELRHQWYCSERSDRRLLVDLIMLSDFSFELGDYRDGFVRDLLVSERFSNDEKMARIGEFYAAVEGLPIFSKWLIDHIADRPNISKFSETLKIRANYAVDADSKRWMKDYGKSMVLTCENAAKNFKAENLKSPEAEHPPKNE